MILPLIKEAMCQSPPPPSQVTHVTFLEILGTQEKIFEEFGETTAGGKRQKSSVAWAGFCRCNLGFIPVHLWSRGIGGGGAEFLLGSCPLLKQQWATWKQIFLVHSIFKQIGNISNLDSS